MNTAHVIVTVAAAAWIGFTAIATFTGAVITVIHGHAYSHIPYPLLYLAPVAAAAVLAVAS